REANPAAPGFTVWQPVWLERPFASRRVDFILLAPGGNTRARVVASRLVLNQPSRAKGRVLWPSDHYGVLSEVEILRRAGDGKARAVGREPELHDVQPPSTAPDFLGHRFGLTRPGVQKGSGMSQRKDGRGGRPPRRARPRVPRRRPPAP